MYNKQTGYATCDRCGISELWNGIRPEDSKYCITVRRDGQADLCRKCNNTEKLEYVRRRMTEELLSQMQLLGSTCKSGECD